MTENKQHDKTCEAMTMFTACTCGADEVNLSKNKETLKQQIRKILRNMPHGFYYIDVADEIMEVVNNRPDGIFIKGRTVADSEYWTSFKTKNSGMIFDFKKKDLILPNH